MGSDELGGKEKAVETRSESTEMELREVFHVWVSVVKLRTDHRKWFKPIHRHRVRLGTHFSPLSRGESRGSLMKTHEQEDKLDTI